MNGHFTIELYNEQGALIAQCGVDNPMQGFAMLAKRDGLDYATATCYYHQPGKVTAQWEVEIK